MNTRRIFVLIVAVLASAVATPALTQDQEERYSGLVQHLGSGPSGETPIEITISRWNTVEEAQALVDVLTKDGHTKFTDALSKSPETGFLRFPGMNTPFPSVRLHYARQFQDGDKRTIILGTNRPIGFLESESTGNSMDYDLTMIELTFASADADGAGVFVVAGDVAINATTHKLDIEPGSTQPARLTNVKQHK